LHLTDENRRKPPKKKQKKISYDWGCVPLIVSKILDQLNKYSLLCNYLNIPVAWCCEVIAVCGVGGCTERRWDTLNAILRWSRSDEGRIGALHLAESR
jgi:hypothetical protein